MARRKPAASIRMNERVIARYNEELKWIAAVPAPPMPRWLTNRRRQDDLERGRATMTIACDAKVQLPNRVLQDRMVDRCGAPARFRRHTTAT
jgi:hypothetical protein